ncbi:bifunctional hydroxymethylpyrimidine kinase/phosphomethylpyrimidine kinase [Marinimicrobium sp. ARAG 43.8]|uniref:bifunctional hydroxymethylpyrimidine kinase/phosphomethylpyrimidine kinase n=1 Tax=Marinimicrobium sp. ARAG 43.8 TaxID=3418719 RepID=UPI003CF8C686
MTSNSEQVPVVLALASHDPSGCTGIQADIETCASLGCHCTPVITSLCARDTCDIKDLRSVPTSFLIEQVRAILEDLPVKAVKLGFLAQTSHIEAIHTILRDYPDLPVVVEPVTQLANGSAAGAEALREAIKNLLLPLSTLATPDLVEAYELAQQADTLDACAQEILECGGGYTLITGTRRTQQHYENRLYNPQGMIRAYRWQRLSVFSHGGGATLSASISAYLAHGLRLMDAIEQGQNFTWHTLSASRRLGMGHSIPHRLFWADRNLGHKRGPGGGC